jgi:dienelactone hydrolase
LSARLGRWLRVLIVAAALDSDARAQQPEGVENAPAVDAAPALDAAPAVDAGSRAQDLLVPEVDAQGRAVRLKARVCRPAGDAPAPLVLINHGSPPNAIDRPKMKLGDCRQEAAQWFLARGFVVGFALRRGYGETGGVWAEDQGGCDHPNFVRAGLESARDIDAAVIALTTLPFVRPDAAVVVGQSAGGWGAIAYNAVPHPKVAAFVVMAGGRGGHRDNRPNDNCRPDLLAEAAGVFGARATTPMLWIYAVNDSYFGPSIARALWHEFTAAKGVADLEQPPAYGADGHRLFFGANGSTVWGPLVERYLAGRGFTANR